MVCHMDPTVLPLERLRAGIRRALQTAQNRQRSAIDPAVYPPAAHGDLPRVFLVLAAQGDIRPRAIGVRVGDASVAWPPLAELVSDLPRDAKRARHVQSVALQW